MPEPLSDTVVGEFVALLVKEAVPVTDPVAWGAKLTFTGWLAPAAMENGKVTPVSVNPEPAVLPEKTVTLELPVFDRVTAFVAVLPTSTLPNERLVGDALSN